ncbi:hypothetical protein F4803DRAFT_414448 [Xylaria telfairii]|nr:hypothetical protein F4803DRAFT_414448 [Xylaria telfairii]
MLEMLFDTYLIVWCLLWTSGSAATPIPTQDVVDLPSANTPIITAKSPSGVITTLIDIAEVMIQVVSQVMSNVEETEINFVESTLDQMASKFPQYNIMMYHDQSSTYNLKNNHHKHVEVNLIEFFDTTKGYEIFVFDTGTFNLAGDGGNRNWGWRGCYYQEQENPHIVHFDVKPMDCPPTATRTFDSLGVTQRYLYPNSLYFVMAVPLFFLF